MEIYKGKRILLLQGPVGPFFARFAKDLRTVGADVWKINFNAGDWLFYPSGITYRGTMEDWPAWIEGQLRALQIDIVFLFGDCRPIHQAAHKVATQLDIEVGVFEEGYIRPHYITLERFGVNNNSRLPGKPADYRGSAPKIPARRPMPKPYWHMVWFGFLYFTIGGFGRGLFPHYRHHRPLTIMEMFPWLLSPLRKAWFAWKERGIQEFLSKEADNQYFFVPLQVYNDAQVTCHADVGGVRGFIESTIASFACHAPHDCLLVFKHHPMDRGYVDYTGLIEELSRRSGCADRVIYVHDQHTPTLINHARGVIVINSTVGLSAIGQKRPTKVCGRALYDMPGLTHQGSLDTFWKATPVAIPDHGLYQNFRAHLVAKTQINGSFYRRLDKSGSATGLIWNGDGKVTTSVPDAAVAPASRSTVVPFPARSKLLEDGVPAILGPELPEKSAG